jgi:hypothetical protein
MIKILNYLQIQKMSGSDKTHSLLLIESSFFVGRKKTLTLVNSGFISVLFVELCIVSRDPKEGNECKTRFNGKMLK